MLPGRRCNWRISKVLIPTEPKATFLSSSCFGELYTTSTERGRNTWYFIKPPDRDLSIKIIYGFVDFWRGENKTVADLWLNGTKWLSNYANRGVPFVSHFFFVCRRATAPSIKHANFDFPRENTNSRWWICARTAVWREKQLLMDVNSALRRRILKNVINNF